MKFIKILLFGLFCISSLNAEQFKDMDYLFYKFKIKHTIEELEKLKVLFQKNSSQYKMLQTTENYFMRNMPIDAYGTYTRMKLHNIIDNQFDKQPIKNNMILKANTDLNMILKMKQQQNNSQPKKNNISQQQVSKMLNPMNNPLAGMSPQQLKKMVDVMNKNNKGF